MTRASHGDDPLETQRAWIYLHGILPLFEDLVAFDQEAVAAIAGQNLIVQFEVRRGSVAHLDIGDGAIRYGSDSHSKPDVRLTFKAPQRLNRMFRGENVRPGLRKGFRHVRFLLRRFPKLADRLSYYLEGDGSGAGDAETRRFLVGLRLRAMPGGSAAVAGHDPLAGGHRMAASLSVHHTFLSAAHTDGDIDRALEVAADAFRVTAQAVDQLPIRLEPTSR